jgi:hypothetical protein
MKVVRLVSLVFVVSLLAAIVTPADAQAWRWGVRGGLYLDGTDPFLGVEAMRPITRNLSFNPNLEYAFADQRIISANADVIYAFGVQPARFVYGGAGLGAIWGDTAELGLNLIIGYAAEMGGWSPYVQLKGVADITGDRSEQIVLGGGIRF